MSRKVARGTAPEQAKGIRPAGRVPDPIRPDGPPADGLSPEAQEAGEAIRRALKIWKAEAIGAQIGVCRTLVYEWRDHPDRIPLGKLREIARIDPDPEFLDRFASYLQRFDGELAVQRKEAGAVTVCFGGGGAQ